VIRLCFLIRQFNDGGAQRQLLEMAKGLDKEKYAITILTYYSGGRFGEEAKQLAHVRHVSLQKRSRWEIVGFLYRLGKQLLRLRPHVLHGYLGPANLLGVLFKPVLPKTRVVWGVRASNIDLSHYDWLARLTFRLECIFARFADLIIVNSHAGRDYHLAHGFPGEKMVVIFNGIDTERFRPDAAARRRVRAEWNVAAHERLIGVVGRLDPMKDHPNFLEAAALLAKTQKEARFVCVGDGPADYRQQLQALGQKLGLAARLIWAGGRNDMPAVYNAMDIFCSSSSSEGFPNAIGEAMACGVPCVVTAAGDSALIVGNAGVVVPPKNPRALADGWTKLLELLPEPRRLLGEQARARVMRQFGRAMLVQKTSEALMQCLGNTVARL
jgi:glycosyltransferase involved in cell wall biosynthesis